MTYDVIIVGAGPAGLSAALFAAQEGQSVLLIETKQNITRYTRPCCSMWLLEPGFHNEAWTFHDQKIFFHRNDFSIPYTGGTVDLHRSVRISPSGATMVMGKKLMPIGKVIDKQCLLENLFDAIEKEKVEIRSRTTCLGIEETNEGVRAKIRHGDSTEWVSGRYLLAADGVDSKVVESMGLNAARKQLIRTHVLYYYFADVKTPYTDSWTQFIGDGFNGVSGSMLHKPDRDGNSNIYEIGAHPPLGSGMGLKESLERLLSHPIIKEWFTDARLIKKMGCQWTCWTPIAEPASGRVIILSDAASFQEVENQGAVMCGFRAVKAITAQENGENGFKDYNRFWQKSFEFNDKEVLKDTWKGFVLRHFDLEDTDYITALSEGKLLDGFVNHFECGNVIFDFLLSQLSRIEQEKPALAEKIKKLQNFKLEENIFGDVG